MIPAVFSCVDISPKVSPDITDTMHAVIEKNGIDTVACGLNFIPGNHYNEAKAEIEQLRGELNRRYKTIIDSIKKEEFLDSSMVVFTHCLLNKIVPYWYGTKWSFEGHTAIPIEGTIACGYFVSTTLRDMGLIINRYRLAQQGPEEEVVSISIDRKNMMKVKHAQMDSVFNILSNHIDSKLFFVGLEYHVGYLYLVGRQSYFIHSSYIDGKVMVENTQDSKAFRSEDYFITHITGNRLLAKKWL